MMDVRWKWNRNRNRNRKREREKATGGLALTGCGLAVWPAGTTGYLTN